LQKVFPQNTVLKSFKEVISIYCRTALLEAELPFRFMKVS